MAIDAREENNAGREPEIICGATESELIWFIGEAIAAWVGNKSPSNWWEENKHRFMKMEVNDG